jgi:transposase InsO family protein
VKNLLGIQALRLQSRMLGNGSIRCNRDRRQRNGFNRRFAEQSGPNLLRVWQCWASPFGFAGFLAS